jgi:hypothetical protein
MRTTALIFAATLLRGRAAKRGTGRRKFAGPADRHAREGASGAVPKHWRKAWRVTCPACGAPLSDTNERPDNGETLRDTSPFAHVWKEALAGEAIIERFFHGDGSFDYSPIALMRALLVQTWRPCGANGRDPVVGWALGTIFPEFGQAIYECARPESLWPAVSRSSCTRCCETGPNLC